MTPEAKGAKEAKRDAFSVLVVEDDSDIAHMLERRLASEGFLVRHATDGQEALREAMAVPPDAIVLDLMLPGMDGYKMARILRQQPGCADVPVVVMSALCHRDNRKRAAKEIGAIAYFTKPFDCREVIEAVRGLLPGSSPARTAAAAPAQDEPNPEPTR